MLPLIVKIIHYCLYASLCIGCIEAYSASISKNSSLPAVMAFGDSFMDTGNNNGQATLVKADFPPYGKDFKGGKPTGRFTNGKSTPDYIVEKLGLKEYLPAYLDSSIEDEDFVSGVSFASGGSGWDSLTSKVLNVFSLRDQLEMFKEYIFKLKKIVGEQEANERIRNSLYVVSWSSNDWAIYTVIPIRSLQYDETAYASFLVNLATDFIQEMHKLGARKIAFFNTPTIGCVPLARTVAGGLPRLCGEKFNEEAKTFNIMLKLQIEYLGRILPHARFTVVDYFKIVQDIIQNRQQYGLEVVDKGCCGTGIIEAAVLCNKLSPTCLDDKKYLFWDSVHLTDKGFSIVVDQALQSLVDLYML